MSFLVDVQRWDAKLQIGSLQALPSRTTARAYDLTALESKTELGGRELEFLLSAKPNRNSISIPFNRANITLFYQPPLTEEFNQADCEVWTETRVKTKDGREFLRPEKVSGSYAVYHASKRDNDYKAGKICQIFRPQLTDANGMKAWGAFNRDAEQTGVLQITVPQAFLDSAKYPVVIDPTFGYTSVGGSAFACTNIIAASTFNLPENGDVTDIRVYMFVGSSGLGVKCAIYDTSSPFNVETLSAEVNPGPDYDVVWAVCAVSPSSPLTAGNHRITAWTGISGSYFYYDSGSANQWGQKAQFYGTFPDPITWDSQAAQMLSIYATYTAGATLISVTDTMGFSDAVAINKTLKVTDSLGMADGVLRHKPTLTIGDDLTFSDAVKTNKTLNITDLLGLADAVDVNMGVLLKEVTDSLTLTDILSVGKTLRVTENLTLADLIVLVGEKLLNKTKLDKAKLDKTKTDK